MVLDTSAVVAILQSESVAERLVSVIEEAGAKRLSAASLVETAIVMQARYGDRGEGEVDVFVQRAGVDVVPVMLDHAEIARSAYRRFGKGRHPAALNFGDCFAYALAILLGEPLLFVGEEFSRTDVLVAAY
jgi:ribonuclease VapC